jgi:hypothetical protein
MKSKPSHIVESFDILEVMTHKYIILSMPTKDIQDEHVFILENIICNTLQESMKLRMLDQYLSVTSLCFEVRGLLSASTIYWKVIKKNERKRKHISTP